MDAFTPKSHLSRNSLPRGMDWCTPPAHRTQSSSACPPINPPSRPRTPASCPPPPRTPSPTRQHIMLDWNTPPEMQPRMPAPVPSPRQFSPFSPCKPPQRPRTPSPCPPPKSRTPSPCPPPKSRSPSPCPPSPWPPSPILPPKSRTPSPCPQHQLNWNTPPEYQPRTPGRVPLHEFEQFSPPESSPFHGPLTEFTPWLCYEASNASLATDAARMRGHFYNLDESDELADFQEQMMPPPIYSKIHGYRQLSKKYPSHKVPMDRSSKKKYHPESKTFYTPLVPREPGTTKFDRKALYPAGYDPDEGVDICLYPESVDWVDAAKRNPDRIPFRKRTDFTTNTSGYRPLPATKECDVSPGRYVYDPKIAEFSNNANKIINYTRLKLNEEFENIFGVSLNDVLEKEKEDPVNLTRARISRKLEEQFGETLLGVLKKGQCE